MDALADTKPGLLHMRQIIEDDRAGLSPRQVDDNGEPRKDGEGEDMRVAHQTRPQGRHPYRDAQSRGQGEGALPARRADPAIILRVYANVVRTAETAGAGRSALRRFQ